MKKIAIALVLVGVAAFGTSSMTPSAKADGAVVINDFGCNLFDGNGALVSVDSSHAVVTPSGNGVVSCKGDVTPPADGKAKRFDKDNTGLQCGTFAGITDQWGDTVSASGRSSLSCHVN